MKERKIFDYVRNVDSVLIMNGGENQVDKTFFYLTGAKSGIFEGSLLHVKPEKVTIITSALEEEAAKETGFEVLIYNTTAEKNEIIKNAFKNDVNVGLNSDSSLIFLDSAMDCETSINSLENFMFPALSIARSSHSGGLVAEYSFRFFAIPECFSRHFPSSA